MKTLIACTTCHDLEYRQKAAAQKVTWVQDLQGADMKFFYGRPTINGGPFSMSWEDLLKIKNPNPDEVWLDCGDDYTLRKEKMKAIFRWVLDQGYDYLWKIDDDVYLRPERLLQVPHWDYCGLVVNLGSTHLRAAMGACYGLSRRSLLCLLGSDTNTKFKCEDDWVGAQLQHHGILPVTLNEQMAYQLVKGRQGRWVSPAGYEDMICFSAPTPENNVIASWEYPPDQFYKDMICFSPPTPENNVIASWEYTPKQMLEIHAQFRCAHVGMGVHGTDG